MSSDFLDSESIDFLDAESRKFMDRMSNDFLDSGFLTMWGWQFPLLSARR